MPQSATHVKAIFDGAVEFIGLLNPDGTLAHCSRTALNLVRARPEDVVNRPFADGPWWASNPSLKARIQEAIAAAARGEQARFEIDVPAADGTSHALDFSLTPVHDEGGAVTMLLAEGHDITARRAEIGRASCRERVTRSERG